MTTKYQIIDEPSPGPLAKVIVNPFWPLLGLMLGGAWLAWPWFLLNSHALGSATQRREQILTGLAFAGSIVLAFLVAATVPNIQQASVFSYALLGMRAFKLTMGYLLFLEQRKSFQIYETFGGKSMNAMAVLAVGYVLRKTVLSLTDNLVLVLILA
jgi:hypothetical protein